MPALLIEGRGARLAGPDDALARGIDIGAKAEIYALMRAFAARGHATIMISSELPEVVGMSDRVCVIQGHRPVGGRRPCRAGIPRQPRALRRSRRACRDRGTRHG